MSSSVELVHDDAVWLSAHIFYNGGSPDDGDAVALGIIGPFVLEYQKRRLLLGYFFIRYRELGPHLRLRMRVRPCDELAVVDALTSHIRQVAPGCDIQPWPGQAMCAIDSLQADQGLNSVQDTATARATGSLMRSVRWIAYEPEVDRYGGPDAIEIAHEHFEASSDAALALLSETEQVSPSARLGRALLLTVAIIHTYFDTRDASARFAARYGRQCTEATDSALGSQDAWSRMFKNGFIQQSAQVQELVEMIWVGLTNKQELPIPAGFLSALRTSRDALHDLVRATANVPQAVSFDNWERCRAYILPSYIHMTNNRLGISIPEERYLAHMIDWVLSGQSVIAKSDVDQPIA